MAETSQDGSNNKDEGISTNVNNDNSWSQKPKILW